MGTEGKDRQKETNRLRCILTGPNSYCSPHDRASQEDGEIVPPKTTGMNWNSGVSFILEEEHEISHFWFPSASGGVVLISCSCSHSQVGLLRMFPMS